MYRVKEIDSKFIPQTQRFTIDSLDQLTIETFEKAVSTQNKIQTLQGKFLKEVANQISKADISGKSVL